MKTALYVQIMALVFVIAALQACQNEAVDQKVTEEITSTSPTYPIGQLLELNLTPIDQTAVSKQVNTGVRDCTKKHDGSPCNDGDPTTHGDRCYNNKCVGETRPQDEAETTIAGPVNLGANENQNTFNNSPKNAVPANAERPADESEITGTTEPAIEIAPRIAFITQDRDDFELSRMELNGADRTNLTSLATPGYLTTIADLEISKDGTKAVFATVTHKLNANGSWSSNRSGLYGMDLHNTQLTKLSPNDYMDHSPRFSNDGSQIVFVSDTDDGSAVFVMNSDGSEVKALTEGRWNNTEPRFGADDAHILFVSDRDGNKEIYAMRPNGHTQVNLTKSGNANGEGNDDDFDISPDGKNVVFASHRRGIREVYVMSLDGLHLTRLTHDATRDLNWKYQPRFSPDGTQVIYRSETGDDSNAMYIVNVDGTHNTLLTEAELFNAPARFSADGKSLIYDAYHNGNWDVFVLDINSGDETNLTNTPKLHELSPQFII